MGGGGWWVVLRAQHVGVYPPQICGNAAPHLRGNVYVNFWKEEAAEAALEAMAGRFYASRPVPTTSAPLVLWPWGPLLTSRGVADCVPLLPAAALEESHLRRVCEKQAQGECLRCSPACRG